MQEELQSHPNGPYLLPRFNPGQGGVDFLGLRQVNLDLMAEYIPGINNVTHRIRPYSVMCWIYWKFYCLMNEQKVDSPKESDMVRFREKVESLFLWGHQLENLRGVPGFLAERPDLVGGRANLSFKAWGRKAQNTSLQAGVQYGPSLSDRGGLGFLHKVEKHFYQVTPRGEALAKSLDERLRKRKSYGSLIDLKVMEANEGEAKELFAAWRSDAAGADERNTFRETLFKESAVGQADALGDRSAMISLIQEILKKSRRTLSVVEIRQCMAYRRLSTGKPLDLSGERLNVAKRWSLLQIRQAQRLAIESLMAWVEYRLLQYDDRNANALAEAAVVNLRTSGTGPFQKEKPAEILAFWLGRYKSFDHYTDGALKGEEQICMFSLYRELEQSVKMDPDEIWLPAFKLLMLCRRFCDWFGEDQLIRKELSRGGSGRISLEFWAKSWDKLCNYSVKDLVAHVLNYLVLSQHFAVATNRFDGGTQRLRITIEEEGLQTLVGKRWQPYVAADRLETLLSLMADCELIKWDADAEGFSL